MKRNVPDLEHFIKDYVESKKDFIAIRWADGCGNQSMVRYELQNRKGPKSKEWDDEKERWSYFWPGLSPTKLVRLIKTYHWSKRCSDSFFCVYRINHTPELEDQIAELIPEENRERV